MRACNCAASIEGKWADKHDEKCASLKAMKFFYHYWGFTMTTQFVEYGDPSIQSWSYWIVPGTAVEVW